MKKLILILLFAFINTGLIYAQLCITCTTDSNAGTCSTDRDFDGHVSCGCGNGCQCYNICTSNGFPILTLNLDNDFDWNSISVPKNGLAINLEDEDLKYIDNHFRKVEFIENFASDDVIVGKSIALYKLSKNKFIVYTIIEGKIDLFSICNNEKIGTLHII